MAATSPTAETPDPPPPGEQHDDRTTLFAFAWALAALVHVAETWAIWSRYQAGSALAVALAAAALLCLIRPRHRAAFLGLVVVWLLVELRRMPFLSNHALLVTWVNLTILAGWRPAGGRFGGAGVATDASARWSPAARWLLLLLYAVAAFHKLNVDYLDLETSCAPLLSSEVVAVFGGELTGRLVRIAPILSIAIEAAFPLLLVAKRTRRLGIGCVLAFHALLSVHPAWQLEGFAAVAVALLLLFLTPAEATRALGALRPRGPKSLLGWAAMATALAVTSWPLLRRAAAGTWVTSLGLRGAAVELTWIAWLIVVVGGLAVAFAKPIAGGVRLRLPGSPAAVVPPLVLVACLGPYLGLRTEGALAMFSNLRTEDGRSNHLLLPSVDPFGWAATHRVLASTDPFLAAMADRDRALTSFELRRRFSVVAEPGFEVVLERDGRRRELAWPEDRADPLFRPPPFLLSRLLWFRPATPPDQPMDCVH